MNERPRDGVWPDVLGQVQSELVELMKPIASTVSLRTGESLLMQGDDAHELYSLQSGRLEVSVISESGQNLALNVLGPGAGLRGDRLVRPGPPQRHCRGARIFAASLRQRGNAGSRDAAQA